MVRVPTKGKGMFNKRFKQWLKILISLILIVYVLHLIDWRTSLTVVRKAHLGYMLLAVALITVERGVSVFKWLILLRVKNSAMGFWRLFVINYIGGFLGLVLPSSVSTDVVRGYYLSRATSDSSLAVSSVVIDRLLGLFSLLGVGCLSALVLGDRFGLGNVRVYLAGFGVLCLCALFLLQNRAFLQLISRKVKALFPQGRIIQHLGNWTKACLDYKQFPVALIVSFGLSVLVQVLRVLVFYVVALGFAIHLPIIYFFIFIPIIMLLLFLPISFAGIGVREASFVSFFSLVGLSTADGFVVSFAVSLLTTLTTAAGGLFYLFDKNASSVAVNKTRG